MLAQISDHPFFSMITGIVAALIVGTVTWLFSVGGFITAEAYASDQSKLDQIIELISTTDSMQTSARKHAEIDGTITNAERRIEEMQLYVAGDPDGALADTRRANIRRLEGVMSKAKRDKAELIRQETE